MFKVSLLGFIIDILNIYKLFKSQEVNALLFFSLFFYIFFYLINYSNFVLKII
jgi:hypothetical protein